MLGRWRPTRAAIAVANRTPRDYPIEKGATLRVLRPSKFVQGDEDLPLQGRADSPLDHQRPTVARRLTSQGQRPRLPRRLFG
jgi:hypothetical protein